ncbi:hypothetical protein ACJIZ3_024976 [Penstemon smallii]|uniref:Uncharacterized protein n=1 Tax=Penstemon smallii TaxID=265156 RepID=A0ABD3TVX4_9LAMI
MQGEEGGLVVRGRVEIDMRQPFGSVREAVMLFGEKVLAGEIYGNKLKEMQSKGSDGQNQKYSKFGAVTAELQETKENLERAKEEGNSMALHLASLKQELEQTKRELFQLKTIRKVSHLLDEPGIDEDVKFIENARNHQDINDDGRFQKKRSVKFANPPLLTKVIVHGDDEGDKIMLSPNKKTKKKKAALIPVIGRLFSKKGIKLQSD